MKTKLLLLCSALLISCSEPPVSYEPLIRPIAWTRVQTSNFEQVRRLSGIVAPVETANLSFLVGGKIQSVKVLLGDKVKAGQELSRLDQRSFNLSLQSSQAQLEQSQATLTEAENEFKRYSELVAQGVVSKSGFDNAKAAYDSAKSAVNVAKAQLELANKNLQDSILLAPYSGIITKRIIEPSQQISPGQTAFEIEGEHGLEVRVMVPENLIQELEKGASLPVHFPALPELQLKGVITEVGTRAESANAFPVVLLLQGMESNLRAGMTAEVDFTFEGVGRTGYKGNTIKVPVAAIHPDTGQNAYVFVYDPEQQVVNKRQVQTENILDNQVLISSGLQDGEIIATAGVAFLRDGQQVSLLDTHIQRFN